MQKKWTTHVDMFSLVTNTTLTTYGPTDGSLHMKEFDFSKYSNIIEAYFEMNGYVIGGELPNSYTASWMQLYDRTNSAEIAVVRVPSSSPDTNRSADISGNLPSGVATLDVRVKKSNCTNGVATGARLIIVQKSSTAPKTSIFIPLVRRSSGIVNVYKRQCGLTGGMDKDWCYIANNFATIDAIYFHANIKAQSGYTALAKMDSTAESDLLAELSTASTAPSLEKSSDISGSITNATDYTTWIKTSAAKTTMTIYNAYVRIDLSPVTKFQNFLTFNSWGTQITATGWVEKRTMMAVFNTGADYYDGVTEVTKHYSVLYHTNDAFMLTSIYDDTVRDGDAGLITPETNPVIKESLPLTLANGSDIAQGYNLEAAGLGKSGHSCWGALSIYISGITATVRRIFIT